VVAKAALLELTPSADLGAVESDADAEIMEPVSFGLSTMLLYNLVP